MGVGVGERAKTVVIFLASSIPEGQLDVLAIDLDVGDVVLEHGGNIHLRVCTCPFSTTSSTRPALASRRTSGKVPLEKTIKRQVCAEKVWSVSSARCQTTTGSYLEAFVVVLGTIIINAPFRKHRRRR